MLTYLRHLGLGRPLTYYEGEGGGGGSGAGQGASGDGGAGAGGQGAAGAGGGQGAGQGGGDIPPAVQAQLDQLQQAVAASNAENRRLKKQAEDAAAAAAKEQGDFKSLYEKEKEARETLESTVTTERRAATVQRVAERLQFRSPSIAHRVIDLDDLGADDEREAERRLKKAAQDYPELLGAPAPRQLPGAGGRQQGGAGTGGDEMNARIRAAAGRAPAQ